MFIEYLNLFQEIFNDSRHKLKIEGCVHTLVITKPAQDDMGKYSVECMGISCSAMLTVDGKYFY